MNNKNGRHLNILCCLGKKIGFFATALIVLYSLCSCGLVDSFYEDDNFRIKLNEYVNEKIRKNEKIIFKINDFTEYDWDFFFCILPYSNLEKIKKKTGIDVGVLKRTGIRRDEGINLLVLIKNRKLLKYVVYPRDEIDFLEIGKDIKFFDKNSARFKIKLNHDINCGHMVQAEEIK